ncbi:MAG: winged helix DNA-binding protein [Novosphingobium sp.]|nr:winged helix DNA-binding protein [Novosphingobium sp.]
MAQANFLYEPANDRAGMPLTVSIFADRPHVRAEMRDDAEAAGFRISACDDVAALLTGEDVRVLGEVVLLDCPALDGGSMAALCRLDMRVAHCGAHLVVSTSTDALDDVFACLDQSNPQILVDPSRAERVIALGRVLAQIPNLRVRELAEEDRLMLLRLTEQVGQIAGRLEGLDAGGRETDGGFRLRSPVRRFQGKEEEAPAGAVLLPDPQLVRQVIRQRHLRGRFFDAGLFADPAWDILLDLTAAQAEGKRVSVTSLCIASGVPPTTALRWIAQMTEAGLLERVGDETDRRRAFIVLTGKAADAMARYFAELGDDAARLA